MTARISIARGEQGVALPLALLALVTLSGLLLAFLSMSGHEVVIAQNQVSGSRAFYIADAGIEHAWAVLPTTDIAAVLQAGGVLFNNQAFGGGSYRVTLTENADGYRLTSTGTYNNASRTINGVVNTGGLPLPLGAAEVLIDASGSYEAHVDPDGSFDGRDWTAPADISACTDIPNCGTKVSNTGTHGAFANSSSQSFDISGSGTMYGTDCVADSCAGDVSTASHRNDSTVPLTRWDNFINATIPKANQTLSGTVLNASDTYTWGTPAAPKITVINNTGNVSWKANVTGAGVLIIDSPGPTNNLVFSTGQLNWQGVVIIRSPGEVQFEIANTNGRIRVFGLVVNRSADRAEIELNKANNFIKYSSASVAMNRRQFFTLRSWQEGS